MFGGLEIKGASDTKKEEEETASAPVASGFSFLSSPPAPTPAEDTTKTETNQEATANESNEAPSMMASGFSFMSSLIPSPVAVDEETKDVAMEANEKDENQEPGDLSEAVSAADNDINEDGNGTTVEAPTTSAFSFMASTVASTSQTSLTSSTIQKDEEVKEEVAEKETVSEPAPVASGFSFMSSPSRTVSETTIEKTVDEPKSETPAPDTSSSTASMFSMLNLKTEAPPSPMRKISTSAPAADDILSLANPKQPTGSGIVFGGAAKPKTVKKRSRTKKIGAASISTAPSVNTAPVSSLPPPVPKPAPKLEVEVATTEKDEIQPAPSHEESPMNFQKLSKKADEANARAEEFMKSIESSSGGYSGRYSGTSTQVEEDYGDTSSAAVKPASPVRRSSDSEDYRKAKAAAQEAMKTNSSSKSRFGGGLMSTFFGKRSATPTPETSTHGVTEKVEEPKVPTYGEARAPSSSSLGVSVSDNSESLQLQRQRELKEEARRLEEREQERIRLEQERAQAEKERIAFEQQQMEAEERKRRVEQQRMEEERQRVEAEEAAKRTPEQVLQNLISDFSIKTQNATLAVSSLRQERAAMMERRTLAEKQERLAAQQISQAEKQLMEAAEQEDFELADQLNAVIEQHKSEQEDAGQILEKIVGLIEDLDYRRLDVVKGVWSCFVNVQNEMEQFLKERESSDITDSTELLKKFESDTKKLAAESERLASYLKNVERDEEFAKEEREELETTIHEQTSGIEELRDFAKEKLDGINLEIEELRRQLEAKEMEAAEVKLELHGHEDSIEQIRNKFSSQLTRLEKKEKAVQESRKEWEEEDNIYKKSREDHEAEVTAHSDALVAHDKLVAHVKQEIKVAESLAKVIAQEVVVEKTDGDASPDDDLLKAQAEVLSLEAALDEAQQVLSSAKSSIDTLREEINAIDIKLPILEADKKLFASKRDFKAAAKTSKEIKELTSKKDRYSEELAGEALEKQEHAQKAVDEAVEALDVKKSSLLELEKECGVKRMVHLVNKIINLEKLREDVCGNGEDDVDGTVKAVGGFVLDAEISALMLEGDELDKKYGGWSDIMIKTLNEGSSHSKSDDIDETEDTPVVVDTTLTEEEITIDKSKVMTEFKELSELVQLSESKLDTAIEEEDYEAAAELNDEIEELKKKMDLLGLTEEEKDSAISGENVDTSQPPEESCGDDHVEDDNVTDEKEVRYAKYSSLTKHLVELEEELEAAIESEDYENAADFNDEIDAVKSSIDALGLSDVEKEMLKKSDVTSDDIDSEPRVETELNDVDDVSVDPSESDVKNSEDVEINDADNISIDLSETEAKESVDAELSEMDDVSIELVDDIGEDDI